MVWMMTIMIAMIVLSNLIVLPRESTAIVLHEFFIVDSFIKFS